MLFRSTTLSVFAVFILKASSSFFFVFFLNAYESWWVYFLLFVYLFSIDHSSKKLLFIAYETHHIKTIISHNTKINRYSTSLPYGQLTLNEHTEKILMTIIAGTVYETVSPRNGSVKIKFLKQPSWFSVRNKWIRDLEIEALRSFLKLYTFIKNWAHGPS